MKKVLSVLLAVLMLASLAVVNVFALPDPNVVTLYEATKSVKDANDELIATPNELKDYEGFGDMTYVAEATFEQYADDALFSSNPFQFTKATAGNTLVFYYYVENTGKQTLFIRRNNSSFDILPSTPGYHVYSITTDVEVTSVNVYLKNESGVAGTIRVYIGSVEVREGAVQVNNRAIVTYTAEELYNTPGLLSNQVELVTYDNKTCLKVTVNEGYEPFVSDMRYFFPRPMTNEYAQAHCAIWMTFLWDREGTKKADNALFIHNGGVGQFHAIAYNTDGGQWVTRMIARENYMPQEYQDNGYFNLHDQSQDTFVYIESMTVGVFGDDYEGTIPGYAINETGSIVGTEVVYSLDANDLMNGRINEGTNAVLDTIENQPAMKVLINSPYHRWFNHVEDYLLGTQAEAAANYLVYLTYYQDKDANIYIHNAGDFHPISTTAGWHTVLIPPANYVADQHPGGDYFNFHDQGANATLYITKVEIVKLNTQDNLATYYPYTAWDGNSSVGVAFANQAVASTHEKVITFDYFVADDLNPAGNGVLYWWTSGSDFRMMTGMTSGHYTFTMTDTFNTDRSRFHHGSASYNVDLYVNSITVSNPGGNPTLETVEALSILTEKAYGEDGGSFACNFASDKVYAITVDYRVYSLGKDKATMTIGNKTVNLKMDEGFYSASVGLTGGATAIVFDVPDGVVIALDKITYKEAAEEYTALASKIENLAVDITLDSTICTNATYAINDLTKVLEVELGDDYVVLSVELEEDGFVAAESALALDAFAAGSLTAYVEIYQISTDLTYSTTLTFAIDEAAPTASMPTGDIIMIVGIVALVSMLALAGVVITKKKLLNK